MYLKCLYIVYFLSLFIYISETQNKLYLPRTFFFLKVNVNKYLLSLEREEERNSERSSPFL